MKTLLLFLVMSGSAMASLEESKVTFEPCRWWTLNFQTNNYECRQKDFRVTVYESTDVDNLVRKLESKIDALEARVKQLEAGRHQ